MDTNAMNERLLWDWIERAWRSTPGGAAIRADILCGRFERRDARMGMSPFFDTLERWLDQLTRDGLVAFCREFERAVFALDREDFARHLGFGDDGFGDARATIVMLGEAHYREVEKDYRRATPVALEAASLFLIRHWEKRYGEVMPGFGVNTSTGSNLEGWPSKRALADAQSRFARLTDTVWTKLGLGRAESQRPTESIQLTEAEREHLEEILLEVGKGIRRRSPKRGTRR